jgi:hypothetical protein
MEIKDNFFDRIYVSFIDQEVFVFKDKNKSSRPEKWSMQEAKEYLRFLK